MLQLLRFYVFCQYLFLSFNLSKFRMNTKLHALNVADVFMPYWVFFVIVVLSALILLVYLVYCVSRGHSRRPFLVTLSSALLLLTCFLLCSATLVSGLILSI